MSAVRKILLISGIVFIAIQFVQPAHNRNDRVMATDISNIVSIPDSIRAILQKVCYDCHSNNTTYPWYSNIQPAGWLMAKHIKQGKQELNFNEFGSYSKRRQISKLNGIANSIRDDIMPLWSYKLMHKNAKLNAGEKTLIMDWAERSKENLSEKK